MLGKSDGEAACAGQVGRALRMRRGSALLAHRDLPAEVDRVKADGAIRGPHDHLRLEPMGNVVVHALASWKHLPAGFVR